MLAIPLLVWVLSTLLILSRYKRLAHPAIIVISWWCFWMALAIANPYGMDTPLLETWFLYAAMLGGFAFGACLPTRSASRSIAETNQEMGNFQNKIFYLFAMIAFPVLVYFAWKSRSVIATLPFGQNRMAIVDASGGENLVTGSTFVRNMIEVGVAGPLLYFSLYAAIYLIRDKRWLLFSATVVFTALYQMIDLGRSQMYRLGLTFVLAIFLIWPMLKRVQKVKLLAAGLAAMIVMVLVMQGFSSERMERKSDQPYGDRLTEFVTYHIAGFTLFDIALRDSDSPLNTQVGYGQAFMAGAGVLLGSTFKGIFPAPYRYTYLDYSYIPRDLGVRYTDGHTAFFNAYLTLLFPLYLDGRIFFVIFIPAILGYLCSYFYLAWRKYRDDVDLAIFLFISVLMLMGIFESLTERTYVFAVLGLLLVAKIATIFSRRRKARSAMAIPRKETRFA